MNEIAQRVNRLSIELDKEHDPLTRQLMRYSLKSWMLKLERMTGE